MVHRDFKPQNILIGSRDHAYLADFGLTQALGEPGLTRTGQFVGTLDYIAPEQIHGKPRRARSDVYAFGAVLFECLTGRVPYERESDAAILFAHVSEPPPRVSEVALRRAARGRRRRSTARWRRTPSSAWTPRRAVMDELARRSKGQIAPRRETGAHPVTRAGASAATTVGTRQTPAARKDVVTAAPERQRGTKRSIASRS